MNISSYILVCMLCILVPVAALQAQEDKRFNNANNVEIPAYQKDSLQKVKEQQLRLRAEDSAKAQNTDRNNLTNASGGVTFDLFDTRPAMVRELDELSIDMGVPAIVKVSEEIRIGQDSAWVYATEYYSVWDINHINPYGRDPKAFNAPLTIQLYEPARGLLWASPLKETLITSRFGPRWGRYHHGVDLNLQIGTPIFAVFDGIVRMATFNRGYGNFVVVRHYNGFETLYAHMSARKIESGQAVKAGQLIGLGGSTGWSTGPHLHFEVRYEGNSIDPLLIFDFNNRYSPAIRSERFMLLPEHFRHYGNQVRTNIYHQVSVGETLESISRRYNVSVASLAQLNQISISTSLRIGQRLKIR